ALSRQPVDRSAVKAQTVIRHGVRRLVLGALVSVGWLCVATAPAPAASPPHLSVSAAILIEQSTGRELYGVNPKQKLAVASTPKLMTALLTLEHERRLGKLFTQNEYYASSVDSQIGLAPGERMSVHDLLLALMLPSAHVRYVVNRNDLVGRVPWINGVKTGHTAAAGYVLIASGHRNGMTLLSAVLGTADVGSRDANTLALLDYGFATFHLVTPVRSGGILARPTVRYRAGVRADVIASRTFTQVFPRSMSVRTIVDAPHQLSGPLAAGSVVGAAIVRAGNRVVARIPLVLKRSLPAVSGLTIAARTI